MIGTPRDIITIDTLLLYYDRLDQQTITIFDVKNERFIRRFMTEGRGPGEVIAPLTLFESPDEKKVCFFELQTGHVYLYEPDDIVIQNNITPQKIFFGDRPANIEKIKEGFIGIGMFDDGRYRLYDSKGNMVFACGKYPFRGEEMDYTQRFFIYQGFLCTSADGNYFAMGSSYCDNLEFYKLENGTAVLTKKYGTYDVKAQMINGAMKRDDDCVMNYKYAFGGKHCYMLYSGETYLEKGRSTIGGRKIIVFDWNGNYIRSYTTDTDIYSFCVDEENNLIYAVTRDTEGENKGGFVITKFIL
ncbi:MAG: BF3164 family lipoprotein [Mangrovibacterium sp.]